MTTHVQAFLRTNTFDQLAAAHGVYATFSKDERKVTLNYDQIEAKETDPLARQCRGLILAKVGHERFAGKDAPAGDTIVVARPFDRFFNHGQHDADATKYFGKTGTRVFEKLDGTLCIVYYDRFQGRWHVGTRNVPEADRPIDGFGTHTFSTLFELALKEHLNVDLQRLGAHLDRDRTYMFELTTPYNRIVVEYAKPQVHLLAIRERHTGKEWCPMEWRIEGLSVPHAPHHQIYTTSDLIHYVTSRPPKEAEGVVVRATNHETGEFVRVKVKNPAYVALNGLRDSVANSPRRLMEVILLGREDDVFPMIPADVAAIGEGYKRRYAAMVKTYDALYADLRASADQTDNPRKALALAVQEKKAWMPYFMERFTDKCGSLKDFIEARRLNDGSWADGFLDNLLNNLPKEDA